ncbi:hypothetical protein HWV62_40701 [Athelia sp. TMB]|nr:hypothetical protein HWV62_40701 [Athelia sp. TMB]
MAPIRGVKSIASATTETTKAPTGKKKKAVGDKNRCEIALLQRLNVPSATNSLLAKPADPALIRSALEFLERDTMGATWQEALKAEFKKPYFLELKEFLISEHQKHTIFPSTENIYFWSRATSLDDVKVVVLGQARLLSTPIQRQLTLLHDTGQAHGLSFSVLPPTKPPPSLKNIYKQIATDIPNFKIPTSGDLTPLANEGVLWLNASLTVRAHNANSHAKHGWETFTAEVIRAVTSRKNGRGVIFFAWGAPAQKACDNIDIDEKKHLVLRSAHPSPLSAHRGFLGNGHFKKANEWLKEKYGEGEEINWAALGSSS